MPRITYYHERVKVSMATALEIFQAEVRFIESVKDDYEVAHGKEDALHIAVLEYIKDYSTDEESREAARIALETCKIDFARHCA